MCHCKIKYKLLLSVSFFWRKEKKNHCKNILNIAKRNE